MERLCQLSGHLETTTTATSINTGLNSSSSSSSFQQPIINKWEIGSQDEGKVKYVNILEEYDYIIIGGGTTGCVLAAKLSENPKNSVLLVEAGSMDEIPDLKIPRKFLEARSLGKNWKFVSEQQQALNERTVPIFQSKILGGSSSMDAMLYVRGNKDDFDSWESQGCKGWGYTDVLPYFLKAENCKINGLNEKYHGYGGPITTTQNQIVNELSRLLINSCEEIGIPFNPDYNGVHQLGVSYTQKTIENGIRCSTSYGYLKGIQPRSNLTIAYGVHVIKVLIEGITATGILYKRGSTRLQNLKNSRMESTRARKEVIISAGVIGSPKILLASGIGPKNDLEELGINVLNDLPVGKNFQDQLNVIQMFQGLDTNSTTTQNISIQTAISQTLQYKLSKNGPLANSGFDSIVLHNTKVHENLGDKPDIFLSFFPAIPTSPSIINSLGLQKHELFQSRHKFPSRGISFVSTLLRPCSRGEVKLRSANFFDSPIVNPNYLEDLKDIDVFINGMKLSRKLAQTKTFQGKIGRELRDKSIPFEPSSDHYLEEYIRKTCFSIGNAVGTCKMGDEEDLTTVVDSRLRVKGIQRLRVVDCSIIPSLPSGSLTALGVMIGEKGSAMILYDDETK